MAVPVSSDLAEVLEGSIQPALESSGVPSRLASLLQFFTPSFGMPPVGMSMSRAMPGFMKQAATAARKKWGGNITHHIPDEADELPSLMRSLGGEYNRSFQSYGSASHRMEGLMELMEKQLAGGRPQLPKAPPRQVKGALTPGAYAKQSDELMGFSKNPPSLARPEKGYFDQKYSYELPVQVQYRNGALGDDIFEDEIKGLNFQHALARALRNWEGASIVPLRSNLENLLP